MEHNDNAPKKIIDGDIKCVLVGNDKVGKKHFVWALHYGHCPTDYLPRLEENYVIQTEVENYVVGNGLWLTCGLEEYARLRPLSYPGTEIFLLCFSVADRNSFDAINSQWLKEVRESFKQRIQIRLTSIQIQSPHDGLLPNVPYLLIGLQTDLRDDTPDPTALQNGQLVSTAEAEELAKQIGALKYLECSARKVRGLKEIMQEVARICLQRRQNDPKKDKKDRERCIIQ